MIIDLECIGEEYCELFINYLMESGVTEVDQDMVNNIRSTIFYNVMSQICGNLDMTDDGVNIRDFYDKVNDIPNFDVLGSYPFIVDQHNKTFFCDITKNLAYKVYSLVNRYIDLSSLAVKVSLANTTLNLLIITVEYSEDSFKEYII